MRIVLPPLPTTTTTTCSMAPRGAAQTHLSNTQDVLQAHTPPFLFYTNANTTIWMCNSSRCLTQSGTDRCKTLVWRALSIFYTCMCARICAHRHLIYMDVHITKTTHTFKHKHNVSLVQHTTLPLFLSGQPIRSQYGLNGNSTP